MPLNPGTRLGPYEVLSRLGAGGMGEVYRARDTRLNREVAIKVLPDLFANDAERMARFTREAQTLAALNHPNIAAIYGIEDRGIVMELVDGLDLSEIIDEAVDLAPSGSGARQAVGVGPHGKPRKDGGLALDHALAIARQIIDALEAAHDIGIVHRDLKPANIKVRHDGTVKVLDFGLAKAIGSEASGASPDPSNSPTLTARATQMGMIIGTAAYMSPEQARGRAVDKRTDVWAFGCVLFEMLSGRKTFEGEDATEIISAVVKSDPDWNALPASVPAHVRTIITRCLIKDRKARIPDLSVVRYLLDQSMSEPSAPVPASAPARGATRMWQVATAVFVVAALAATAAWYRARSVTPAVASFSIAPPDGMTFMAGNRSGAVAPAISPDGRTLAFTARDASGTRMLWVRPIDSLVARPLAGTEGASFPFWSPDSSTIGYSILEKVLRVAATGGPPQTVCALLPGITSRGGAWSRDNVVIFNNGPTTLYRAPAGGGEATPVGEMPTGQTGQQFPSFLPDGRHFFYHAGRPDDAVWIGSLDTGESKRLLSATSSAVFAPQSGHLLFGRQGTLMAQKFDVKTLTVTGDAFPVAERLESAAVSGVVAFSVSNTGVLAYGIGEPADSGFQMTWMDRQGKALGTVGPVAQYRGLDLSPDDSQVAAHRHDGDGGDIWITDVVRGTTSRFTFDEMQDNAAPVWSPNGARIAFSSMRAGKPGVYVKASNNTGAEERVYEAEDTGFMGPVPLSWSRDELSMLFVMADPKMRRDLWVLPMSGERKAAPLLRTPFAEQMGQISPDGKWLAYVSGETGSSEVYIQSVPPGAGKWPISTGGGATPRWRRDSRELFYFDRSQLNAVTITASGTTLKAGVPKVLFGNAGGGRSLPHSDYNQYAVTSDGQRFLMTRSAAQAAGPTAAPPMVVVLNWTSGIRK